MQDVVQEGKSNCNTDVLVDTVGKTGVSDTVVGTDAKISFSEASFAIASADAHLVDIVDDMRRVFPVEVQKSRRDHTCISNILLIM